MSWIAVGVVGGSALLKLGEGAVQTHNANQIDKNNPYPSYQIPAEYQQNLNQAQNMSQEGIPQAAYNAQQTDIRANQANALHTIGGSANPTNAAAIVRQGDQATGQLNAQDAIQRNRNLLTLLQERQTLAQQKDKQWDWNTRQKYLGNLAKSQALRTAGNSNISGAFSDISGGASAVAGNGGFGGGSTTGTSGLVKQDNGYIDNGSTPGA